MNFIETMTLHLINLDDVSMITYELSEISKIDRYYSYIHMKNGEKYDFIEYPDYFDMKVGDEVKSIKWDAQHAARLNRTALSIVLSSPCILKYDDLDREMWRVFIARLEEEDQIKEILERMKDV